VHSPGSRDQSTKRHTGYELEEKDEEENHKVERAVTSKYAKEQSFVSLK